MPTVPEFNLRTLVREVLDGSALADPGGIADEVYRRTAAKDRAAAYRQALRQFVRLQANEQRMTAAQPSSSSEGALDSGQSAKVAGIRTWWRSSLRERIHVDGEAGWKMLADCTRDDLMYAAKERWEAADRTKAVGDKFSRLAELLDRFDAATVGDLPDGAA